MPLLTSTHLSWRRSVLVFSAIIVPVSWLFMYHGRFLNLQSIKRLFHPSPLDSPSSLCTQDSKSVDLSSNLTAVLSVARSRASHSWEYGVLAEALLELYNPELSVFGTHVFPGRMLPHFSQTDVANTPGFAYVAPLINTDPPSGILIDGSGLNSDPASLGVFALLLGQAVHKYKLAASRQLDTLLHATPRFNNTATISHRASSAEIWADSVYMVPPFLAYSAVASQNVSLMREAVKQCELHRAVLQARSKVKVGGCEGAWQHFVVGPGGEFSREGNPGLWSTSNGWAVAGMLRVLATLLQ